MRNSTRFGISLLFSLLTLQARAAEIRCAPGGNAAIQACIDQAASGDTIVFAGSYPIDPAQAFVSIADKSDLKLVGDSTNPPLFNCQLGLDGRPTAPADIRFNSAFNVRAGANQVVSGLVFDGLRFSDCWSAVTMSADTGGSYAGITVANLAITNSLIGLYITAPAADVAIRDNSIARSNEGIWVWPPVGHSTGIDISDNEVIGLGDDQLAKVPVTGILLRSGDGRVHDNTVTGFNRIVLRAGLAIAIVNDDAGASNDVSVFDNHVASSTVGISISGRATAQGRVYDNLVESCSFGINLRFGANGWRVGPNEIHGSAIVDVNLVPALPLLPPPPALADPFGTRNNIIYLSPGQKYNDPGGLNTIIVQ